MRGKDDGWHWLEYSFGFGGCELNVDDLVYIILDIGDNLIDFCEEVCEVSDHLVLVFLHDEINIIIAKSIRKIEW